MIKVNSRIDQLNAAHYGMWLSDIQKNSKGATRSMRRLFEQLGDTPNQIEFGFDLLSETEPDYLGEALQKTGNDVGEFQLQLISFGEHLSLYYDANNEFSGPSLEFITETIPSYKSSVRFEYAMFRETGQILLNPVITVQFDQQLVLDAPFKIKQIFIETIDEMIWKFRNGIAFHIGRYIDDTEDDENMYITRTSCKRKLEELKKSNLKLHDLEDEYLKKHFK